MQFVMIFSLIIAVFAVMFSMQNTESVVLHFFVWTFRSPLAVLLLISLTIGAILTSLLTIPGWFKSKRFKSRHQKEIVELEDSLAKYRTDLIDTQNKNKDLRQKILELEEATEKLDKAHQDTDREINDLHEALNNANLTLEEAEQAKKEAIEARDAMDKALSEMETKLASPFFSGAAPVTDIPLQVPADAESDADSVSDLASESDFEGTTDVSNDSLDAADETDETLPSDTGEKSANQDKYSFGSLFSKKYGDEADKDPHSFQ